MDNRLTRINRTLAGLWIFCNLLYKGLIFLFILRKIILSPNYVTYTMLTERLSYFLPTCHLRPAVSEIPFLPPLCIIAWPKAKKLSLNLFWMPTPYWTYGFILISGNLISFAVTLDLSSRFQTRFTPMYGCQPFWVFLKHFFMHILTICYKNNLFEFSLILDAFSPM